MSGISKLEGIGGPRPQGRKLLPVPQKHNQTPGQEADGAGEGGPKRQPATLRPASIGTPTAPFLAQLALQYDDVSASRAARSERQTAAAEAYVAGRTARQARISAGRTANQRV